MELKVDFKEASGSVMTIPEYDLPGVKPGDTVTLFDDDIECDCKVIGRHRSRTGPAMLLVMIPREAVFALYEVGE